MEIPADYVKPEPLPVSYEDYAESMVTTQGLEPIVITDEIKQLKTVMKN